MRDTTPRKCSACDGEGRYIYADWRSGYPKKKCDVCNGTGQMQWDNERQQYGPPSITDEELKEVHRDYWRRKGFLP